MPRESNFWKWKNQAEETPSPDVEQEIPEDHKFPYKEIEQTDDFNHGLDTVPGSVEDAVITEQKFPYQDVEPEQ